MIQILRSGGGHYLLATEVRVGVGEESAIFPYNSSSSSMP